MRKPIFSTRKKIKKRITPKTAKIQEMKEQLSTWERIQFENKMLNKYGQMSA
jgi:hypothetical protein